MAYGIWPLAVDFWLSAKHFGGPESSYRQQGRTRSSGGRGPSPSLWAPSGHPKPPKRTPKPTQSTPKSPKCAQTSTTRRPAAKNHRKRSPKHVPEHRRTMKKLGFPLVFVYFAESPWPMAFGPWPSTFGSRHKALGPQNRVARPAVAVGSQVEGVHDRAFGRQVATQSRQRGPQS